VAIAMKIPSHLKNLFMEIATKFRGNRHKNPALFKKKHENNGNVENVHGIIRPYVVVAPINLNSYIKYEKCIIEPE
jgi:hypothetical protein